MYVVTFLPQTILLNTLISEFVVLDNPLNKEKEERAAAAVPAAAVNETVQGLILLDTHLVVYGQFTWVVFDMTGKELSRHRRRRGEHLHMTSIFLFFLPLLLDFITVQRSAKVGAPGCVNASSKLGQDGRSD